MSRNLPTMINRVTVSSEHHSLDWATFGAEVLVWSRSRVGDWSSELGVKGWFTVSTRVGLSLRFGVAD